MSTCATCRGFYEQELTIARTLSRTADHERVPAPGFLQARTLAALNRQSSPAGHGLAWTRLAVGTGLVAALIIVFFAVSGPPPSSPVSSTAGVSRIKDQLAKLESRWPDQQQFSEWSTTLDEPLDNELHSLVHDARQAAQGLIHSFVPASLAGPLTESQASP